MVCGNSYSFRKMQKYCEFCGQSTFFERNSNPQMYALFLQCSLVNLGTVRYVMKGLARSLHAPTSRLRERLEFSERLTLPALLHTMAACAS